MTKVLGRPLISMEAITFDGWKQLNALVMWASQEYIAEELGMSADTLSRRIKEKYNCTFAEYKTQKREAIHINLLMKQYEIAMKGNVSMLIWLGKNELNQSDKATISNSDKPFKLAYNFDTPPEEEPIIHLPGFAIIESTFLFLFNGHLFLIL